MVMDVVESVKLMEQDESGFVRRWRQLVEHVEQQILPAHGGRIVKSLGDGLMLEFGSARHCVQSAFAIQSFGAQDSDGVVLQLRFGIHQAEFVADRHDIYGTGVNLTARVATLAGPGQVVVTAIVRDELTDSIDADIEDMGECYLKHVAEPLRAYRLRPPGQQPQPMAPPTPADFRPVLAVIPFQARSNEPEHFVVGEVIADGVIALLSQSPDIRVISRLSSSALRLRTEQINEAQARLAASFVLSGSYVASGSRLLLMAQLVDVRSGDVIWAERIRGDVMDLLEAESAALNALAIAVARALIDTEVARSATQPLPRLDSHELMLGSINLMHRSSVRDFDRSREMLVALVERHNRVASSRAWLAKWHVLRIVRGLSDNPRREADLALDHAARALDLEPQHALTLSVAGLAYSQVFGDFDRAEHSFSQAIAANPNESMAWLFKSVLSTMWGSATSSVDEALRACSLSPIDPLKYMFELITASALLTDNQHEQAIEHAQRSVRANRHHAPTWRVLVTAHVELSQFDEARHSLAQLLQEQPSLTVASYLAIGSNNAVTRQRCAQALRMLGVPEN